MSGLSFESESILAEARAAFAPSLEARQRIRSGVAGRLTAGSAIGAAAGAGETAAEAVTGGGVPGGAIGSSSLFKLAAVGAIAVVLAGGWGLWKFVSSGEHPAPSMSAAPPAARQEPATPSIATPSIAAPAIAAPAIAAPSIDAPEVPAVRPTPRDERPALERRARRPHKPRADGELAQEIALVRAAQSALRQGRPVAAFALLERHEREIRKPQMEREAWLLRAESLCTDGRAADGKRVLARVRERWPSSAGTEAVGRLCAGANR